MAMAFTSLGLAGLLVTTVLSSLSLGSAGAAAPQGAGARPASTSAAAPEAGGGRYGPPATDSAAQFGPLGQPSQVIVRTGGGYGKSSDAAASPDPAAGQADRDQVQALQNEPQLESRVPGASPAVVGSLILLGFGLALFGLRFVARRTR
jgi:hypothetical protein